MSNSHDVQVRRVYDAPAPEDGTRVLVDRIWPRGLTKEKASLDEWCKQIAPSTELRKWYGHDPDRFAEFTRRYQEELTEPERAEALAHLREVAQAGTLTLLTASRAADISEAAVLAGLLRLRQPGGGQSGRAAILPVGRAEQQRTRQRAGAGRA
jgi:uncharacterized protein YeaO (DUF488 family)